MKSRIPNLCLGALVAGALSCGAVWAADTSSGAAAEAQQGTQPSVKNMDANAQRAHSRSGGTEPGMADAAKSKGMKGESTSSGAAGDTRDWSQVDANHDNSVSADEMQAYLDQHRPSGAAKASDTPSATPAPKK